MTVNVPEMQALQVYAWKSNSLSKAKLQTLIGGRPNPYFLL